MACGAFYCHKLRYCYESDYAKFKFTIKILLNDKPRYGIKRYGIKMVILLGPNLQNTSYKNTRGSKRIHKNRDKCISAILSVVEMRRK